MRRSIALPIACVLLLSACSGSGPSANPSATGSDLLVADALADDLWYRYLFARL